MEEVGLAPQEKKQPAAVEDLGRHLLLENHRASYLVEVEAEIAYHCQFLTEEGVVGHLVLVLEVYSLEEVEVEGLACS